MREDAAENGEGIGLAKITAAGESPDARCVWRAFAGALAITAVQVMAACLLASQPGLRASYAQLCRMDGDWYARIVREGYFTRTPLTAADFGNVAFFPAYPWLARLVWVALGVTVEHALLFLAQAACCLFWTYVLLQFRRWRLPARWSALGVLLIVSHPACFYLVAAYTESLFLAGLMGFLFWTAGRPGLAAGHGFVMTATRLVGVPLVIYPPLQAWVATRGAAGKQSPLRRALVPLGVAGVAGGGALLFFGFCAWRFGRWNLYMQTNAVGWNVHPDYLALLSPRIFHVHWPHWSDGFIDPDFLSRLCVPLSLLLFLGFGVLEWRLARTHADSGWRQRLGLYACAWLMFYISASGHASRHMGSMIRFGLCVHVMLVLALCHLLGRFGLPRGRLRILTAVLLGLWCVVSFACQIALTYRFTHGKWVA